MKIVNKAKHAIMYYKEYGCVCFLITFLNRLFPYKPGSSFRWRLLQTKHKVLLDYLSNRYYPFALKAQVKFQNESKYGECIWTAWLQGEEAAPEPIKMTLASIRKNANGHQVIVLTNDNIDHFVDVPQEIKEKYQRKIIINAHYADVVRMLVLAKYGGLWLDATTMLQRPIDETSFSKVFYSVALPETKPSRFVSNYKWIVGILGGTPESMYLSQISSMLNAYWYDHETSIDYLVFDYLIAVLYQKDKAFSEAVDVLPRMKNYAKSLQNIMNTPYDENVMKLMAIEGQYYHITYKKNYLKKLPDGRQTMYGHFIESYLKDGEGN